MLAEAPEPQVRYTDDSIGVKMRRLDPNDPADRLHIARNASALGVSAGVAVLIGSLLLVLLAQPAVVRIIGLCGAAVAAVIIAHFISLSRFVRRYPDEAAKIHFPKVEAYARLSPRRQALRVLAIASFLFFPAVLMVAGVMERSFFERFVIAPVAIAIALGLAGFAVWQWRVPERSDDGGNGAG